MYWLLQFVNYVILIFGRGNRFLSFFKIIQFWRFRLFFFVDILSLVNLSFFSNSGLILFIADPIIRSITYSCYQNPKRLSKEVLNSIPKTPSLNTSCHARIYWLLCQIDFVTWVQVDLNWCKVLSDDPVIALLFGALHASIHTYPCL